MNDPRKPRIIPQIVNIIQHYGEQIHKNKVIGSWSFAYGTCSRCENCKISNCGDNHTSFLKKFECSQNGILFDEYSQGLFIIDKKLETFKTKLFNKGIPYSCITFMEEYNISLEDVSHFSIQPKKCPRLIHCGKRKGFICQKNLYKNGMCSYHYQKAKRKRVTKWW